MESVRWGTPAGEHLADFVRRLGGPPALILWPVDYHRGEPCEVRRSEPSAVSMSWPSFRSRSRALHPRLHVGADAFEAGLVPGLFHQLLAFARPDDAAHAKEARAEFGSGDVDGVAACLCIVVAAWGQHAVRQFVELVTLGAERLDLSGPSELLEGGKDDASLYGSNK